MALGVERYEGLPEEVIFLEDEVRVKYDFRG